MARNPNYDHLLHVGGRANGTLPLVWMENIPGRDFKHPKDYANRGPTSPSRQPSNPLGLNGTYVVGSSPTRLKEQYSFAKHKYHPVEKQLDPELSAFRTAAAHPVATLPTHEKGPKHYEETFRQFVALPKGNDFRQQEDLMGSFAYRTRPQHHQHGFQQHIQTLNLAPSLAAPTRIRTIKDVKPPEANLNVPHFEQSLDQSFKSNYHVPLAIGANNYQHVQEKVVPAINFKESRLTFAPPLNPGQGVTYKHPTIRFGPNNRASI